MPEKRVFNLEVSMPSGVYKRKKGVYRGEKNSHWKGGRVKMTKGYIHIYMPSHPLASNRGYVLEHRLVVEKHLGRYLKPKEVVHHLEERDDNRPCMLMAFVNDPVHKRFHKNPDNVKLEEIIFDGRKL